MMSALQFAPFSSAIDSGFWYQLTQKKLDEFKLDDRPVDIHGFYSNRPGLPPVFNVDFSAFEPVSETPPEASFVCGLLLNTNTLEDFKNKGKRQLLQNEAQEIWSSIADGRAVSNPSILQRVVCLTFADLKKYHYYYWMAFPALTYPQATQCEGTKNLQDVFDAQQMSDLWLSHGELKKSDRGAFFVHLEPGGSCSAYPLQDYGTLKEGKILLGFVDPSGIAHHPGWPLRNLLALVTFTWGSRSWEVVCLRDKSNSIVLSLSVEKGTYAGCPEAVGWEMSKGKLGPRKVDMSAAMDPQKLAECAVDLNLKLMRWRLSPKLDLERIKETRCLLLGAGTLGCNVARCLMGWGVRKITFVDNARVSYSNPVRQSLFVFEDSKGVPKATAAAAALKTIFPGMDSDGIVLNIPMPGHSVPQKMESEVESEVEQLEKLVKEHDVLFLLMDTRESRWLPTLMAQIYSKLVINAALGFDTFLVMRHGLPKQPLGCYFCNDVMAPGNSTQDRTLDQQCTVTRPGLSYVASALAVELMVSLLQHPKGELAPASKPSQSNHAEESELGMVPHQIRGYLDRFHNMLLTSQAFDRCTACSPTVRDCYREKRFEFLLRVFNDPNYLEQVTGLSELMSNVSMDEIIALSDDDSDNHSDDDSALIKAA